MDVLGEILASLRLTGGVVIDGCFSGDFCVAAEFTPGHCAPFFPVPERLISYHYVRSGRLVVEMAGMEPREVAPGTIIILPRNDPHRLASACGLEPADVERIGWVTAEGLHRVTCGTGEGDTRVWCGFLGTARAGVHPLLDALPALLVLDVTGGSGAWVDSSMRFVAEAQPEPEMVAKLAELFLAQAIRDYLSREGGASEGWVRALADPALSRALGHIHRHYREPLSVDALAREAGVSKTVLGEKFAELLGEPPIRYCGRWRLRVAANRLLETGDPVASIAYDVGFNSEAAFSRAFKREYGIAPAAWRRPSPIRECN
ncbi:AraC family transcriptional regulator [Sphingomonas piscis]|uniref:AraC family transcriptional regulator n=1 Tax=Sphingomonas piscis TaxID=2714943 RepID=A0A6G7YMA9_9SPHN|nr:AraC family transcriptional regulator [Sphingomonas piscis]QIK77879.1 AraC family transcriptional regulator [Sphingomonas piscis]